MDRQTRENTIHSTYLGGYSVWIAVLWFLHLLDVGSKLYRSAMAFYPVRLTLRPNSIGMTVGSPILGLMRYQNTEYMITDQRIITQTGAIGLDTRFVDFDKIQEVYVKVGFIDKMFGTGTVLAVTAGYVYVGTGGPFMRPSLAALKEPYEVQKLLQEAIEKARMTRTRR